MILPYIGWGRGSSTCLHRLEEELSHVILPYIGWGRGSTTLYIYCLDNGAVFTTTCMGWSVIESSHHRTSNRSVIESSHHRTSNTSVIELSHHRTSNRSVIESSHHRTSNTSVIELSHHRTSNHSQWCRRWSHQVLLTN